MCIYVTVISCFGKVYIIVCIQDNVHLLSTCCLISIRYSCFPGVSLPLTSSHVSSYELHTHSSTEIKVKCINGVSVERSWEYAVLHSPWILYLLFFWGCVKILSPQQHHEEKAYFGLWFHSDGVHCSGYPHTESRVCEQKVTPSKPMSLPSVTMMVNKEQPPKLS